MCFYFIKTKLISFIIKIVLVTAFLIICLKLLTPPPQQWAFKPCPAPPWDHLNFFFFLWRYSPPLGLGLPPWNFPFHFSLLDLGHLVGLLGRVISSLQGLYLLTNTEKRTYTNTKHPCRVGFEPTVPASERAKRKHATARLPWLARAFKYPGIRRIKNNFKSILICFCSCFWSNAFLVC
jgi:hypothetical protein